MTKAYLEGFSKMAEAWGVDPQALLQKEAEGRVPVQALLRMILPKARSLRQLISHKANVNRTPFSMITRGGRDRALRDAREHFSWFSDAGVRSADNLQLLRQMNGNKGALTDAMKAQMTDQQTAGKAYGLLNPLVGLKLPTPK